MSSGAAIPVWLKLAPGIAQRLPGPFRNAIASAASSRPAFTDEVLWPADTGNPMGNKDANPLGELICPVWGRTAAQWPAGTHWAPVPPSRFLDGGRLEAWADLYRPGLGEPPGHASRTPDLLPPLTRLRY